MNRIIVWIDIPSVSKYNVCYKNRISYIIFLKDLHYTFNNTSKTTIDALLSKATSTAEFETLLNQWKIKWNRFENKFLWYENESELDDLLCYSWKQGFVDIHRLEKNMVHIFWDGETMQYQFINNEAYEIEIENNPIQINKLAGTWIKTYKINNIVTISGQPTPLNYRYLTINYHEKGITPTGYLFTYKPPVIADAVV